MKGISFALAAVFIVPALHQGISASKPEMTPAAEEIIIQEGEDLRLECRGEGRLQFSTQTVTEALIKPSKDTVVFDEASGTHTFVRPSTTRRDTGWYACAEEDIPIKNDEQTIDHPSEDISWIYVYVNSSQPFAIMGNSYKPIEIPAGSDVVLPCRPTSHDLPVIFEIPDSDVSPSLLENFVYDPKIGFIFKNVSNEFGEKNYKCKLNGTHENKDIMWPLYFVQVGEKRKLLQPTIIGEKLQHVVLGKDMTLECIMTSEEEMFGLFWKAPSSVPKERIHYSRHIFVHRSSGIKGFTIKRELTVENVQKGDGGEYICYARTSEGMTFSTKTIKILEQRSVTINNNRRYYAPRETEIFSSDTYGSPRPNVTWEYVEYPDFPSKNNSKLIPLSNIRTVTKDKTLFHLMSNVNVTINMTGNVICRSCIGIYCTENNRLIWVSEVARDFGMKDPGIVTEGDDIEVLCAASVYNYTDNIAWKLNDSGKLGPNSEERISVKKGNSKFTWQAILGIRNVMKSDAGVYFCEAVNNKGHASRKLYQLLVETAQPPVLTYTNMNDSEIRRDLKEDKNSVVILECRANGKPIPEITWYKNNEPIKKSKQYKFLSDNTKLQILFFSDADTDSGRYLCRAHSRVGTVESYIDIKITGQSDGTILWISLICVLIVIIIIVITYVVIKIHRERVFKKEIFEAGLTHFQDGAPECLNPDLPVDDQAELLPYDQKWEFPREQLKLGRKLGSGAFGVVMKAEARGICVEGEITTVAVKMVRQTAEPSYMKALSSELKIMIHLGRHLNVVNLLGACTKTIFTKRELYVIVEYCRFGNLHDYLQRHRASFIDQIDPTTQKIDPNIGNEPLARSEIVGSQNSVSIRSSDSNSGSEVDDYRQGPDFGDINMSPDGGVLSNNPIQPGWRSNYRGDYKGHTLKPICTQDLLCWAWQVACGMEYLSARNVLHGDLAARNILLADDNVVKICDFGLARNMYKDNNYKKKGDSPLPIKWMAVESIRDRIFSTQSDVWSFGIVLWEFFTLARIPYPGMGTGKQYDRLIEGYRMEKPEYATDEIYEIMLHTWRAKPSLRPSFPELVEKIGTLLNEGLKRHYSDLNTPHMDMNTMALQNGQSDYLAMLSAPSHDYYNFPHPATLQDRPHSAYVSMSLLSKVDEPVIFSPHSELGESRSNFPPPSKNTPINSDSEDCIGSAPMLSTEDPYMKPIDVQQRRAEFVKQNKEQLPPVERDSGYWNVTTIPKRRSKTR